MKVSLLEQTILRRLNSMLDPQEVRKRRQSAILQSQLARREKLMEEAKKIFQWILKLIDEDTKKGCFSSITVYQYDRSDTINYSGEHYDQCSFSRDEIFPIICEVINSEDGYHAEFREKQVYYDEDA